MYRFVGGSQVIAFRIAAEVLRHRIFLSSPVRRIVQNGKLIKVETDKLKIYGKRVIVAVPPTLAARIEYSPLLPFQRDQLTQRYGMGALTKVAAAYEKPFWRAKGYNGTGLDPNGLVTATFDDSPPDGSPGIVFGFVGGDRCREYASLSESDRRQRVLAEFATLLGARGAQAHRLLRDHLGQRAVDARLPGRASPGRACCLPTAIAFAARSTASTGRGPRHRPTGTGTWTAPCAPASGRQARCSTGCEAPGRPRPRPRRAARRGSPSRAPRSGPAGTRASSR